MGDQPEAIRQLTEGLRNGVEAQTLLGVTGSGKTFTIANVIAQMNKPVLVLSHNKTLAAQLYSEFKGFFPNNAVEYYVSYYDYYQPEAYIAATDTYIEKDLAINEDIDKLRLAATSSLLSGRNDVIVVSSVSCIYGMGNPAAFYENVIELQVGKVLAPEVLLRRLIDALYTRNDVAPQAGNFRVKGDTVDIYLAYADEMIRVSFWDNEIDSIEQVCTTSGVRMAVFNEYKIYPANLFLTSKETQELAIRKIQDDLLVRLDELREVGKELEAKRLEERVTYDIEMIRELGHCSGIENYSRYFDGREPGTRPYCLLDFFPDDFLIVIDESHVSVPQISAMYGGDRARKVNLVEYGFRLPAAIDNRPLRFEEFESLVGTSIYVSATPADYELIKSEGAVVEQLIRPTGLVDPPLQVKVTDNQIDDLMEEIDARVRRGDKVLVTTLTKRMAEELSRYFDRVGVRNRYIHSDIETLERVQILDDLRAGSFDVLVGVNLLREGLDLPEVGLVAIMDADKEGFLRNVRSITQIAGRAARHAQGNVIMYAERCTDSMRLSIEESNRRREKQLTYNIEHQMLPRQAQKSGSGRNNLLDVAAVENEGKTAIYTPLEPLNVPIAADIRAEYNAQGDAPQGDTLDVAIATAREQMERAAKELDFMAAAKFRDLMYELQRRKEEQK